MLTNSSEAVQDLPRRPDFDGRYVFRRLRRTEVTEFNHGLHKYPAKFIPQIPRWALRYLATNRQLVVLDPFCGSGTTLVEAGLHSHASVGVDVNPLAVLITRAKTAVFSEPLSQLQTVVTLVARAAQRDYRLLEESLTREEPAFNLHYTWTNWFRAAEMARLLALRHAIEKETSERDPMLRDFLLVCLSAIAKGSSYLSEDQIKVRFDGRKEPRDPLTVFPTFALRALEEQANLGRLFARSFASFRTYQGSATELPLSRESIDAIITSPPYINAVDYTMTHKYNFFILGLVTPEAFKAHCRTYIGMTERAVRASDLDHVATTGIDEVDSLVAGVRKIGTAVARNRSFVLGQFFSGMAGAFREMRRVLKPDGRAFVVIGSANRICGTVVPTGMLLERIASHEGLRTELRFFHELANRSSMRLQRSSTGGTVKAETVLVFSRD